MHQVLENIKISYKVFIKESLYLSINKLELFLEIEIILDLLIVINYTYTQLFEFYFYGFLMIVYNKYFSTILFDCFSPFPPPVL